MKLKYKLWLSVLILFASCKKFVSIDPPQTQVVTSAVFTTNDKATSAVTVIYSQMINRDVITMAIPYLTGISGDELTLFSTYSNYQAFYKNSLTPLTGNVQGSLWQPAYRYIYEANAVIEGLQNSKTVSEDIKKQLVGEAKFIRAFWHFYLLNLFGDIPLATTTDYSVTSTLSRSSKTTSYNQIVADLKDAQDNLSSNFFYGSSLSVSNERTRPTKWAATALLARVYLYMGDWANAEIQSNLVINNSTQFSLLSNLDDVFLKNSREAIWQLQPVATNANTPEGSSFILTTPPVDASNYSQTSAISLQLINAFDSADNRKTKWLGKYTDTLPNPDVNYYYPYKYKQQQANGTKEYEMVLRLAEQYLIRAEARVYLGNPTGAVSDLNTIRTRAGLFAYGGSTAQGALLSAILHERQVELFTEWGHRWLDLKRAGTIDQVMGSVGTLKGGSWNANWKLYPIPFTEIQTDPNLTQNPGY